MVKVLKVASHIFIEVDDKTDPETIAQELDLGLENALRVFPMGEIIAAGVETISVATDEELEARGLKED